MSRTANNRSMQLISDNVPIEYVHEQLEQRIAFDYKFVMRGNKRIIKRREKEKKGKDGKDRGQHMQYRRHTEQIYAMAAKKMQEADKTNFVFVMMNEP